MIASKLVYRIRAGLVRVQTLAFSRRPIALRSDARSPDRKGPSLIDRRVQ